MTEKEIIKLPRSEEFSDEYTEGRCYFCNRKNNGEWDINEDAVCRSCGEKYKYDEDEDCYLFYN